MTNARVEVFVEPFHENAPGAHVAAAVTALESAGLPTEMGPFATVAEGPLDQVVGAVAVMLRTAFDNDADAIQVRIERTN